MTTKTISSIENRYYRSNVYDYNLVSNYFSENAMIVKKFKVEKDYLLFLLNVLYKNKLGPKPTKDLENELNECCEDMNTDLIKTYLAIEDSCKHDIKAIEIYINNNLNVQFKELCRFIHFGLTSNDINSVSISSTIMDYKNYVLVPKINQLLGTIENFSNKLDVVIPARTHGQTAVPTSFKKEIMVFHYRLKNELERMKNHKMSAKFGGAVGNLSAHKSTFPQIDWDQEFDEFLRTKYNLNRSRLTTQVDNNSSISIFFQILNNIANILLDFSRDIWLYYSYGYLSKAKNTNHVGSSTMPQKSNPIEFENAEGNLEYAINQFVFFANKLQVSRLQRDLSDSTVLRNLGVPIMHFIIAVNSMANGINKTSCNKETIQKDLDTNYLMGSEWLQTVLRTKGDNNAYFNVKDRIEKVTNKQEFDNLCIELVGKTFDPIEYVSNINFT